MKTKLFSMFAVVAMLLTTSCSNDETNELVSGEPVTTSFKDLKCNCLTVLAHAQIRVPRRLLPMEKLQPC